MRGALIFSSFLAFSMAIGTAVALAPPSSLQAGVLDQEVSRDGRGLLRLTTDNFHLDHQIESMEGPYSMIGGITLESPQAPKGRTFWLKGIRARTEAQGGRSQPDEFFCHSSLAVTVPGRRPDTDDRLFTLVEGRLDLELPKGYGLPVRSDVKMSLDTTSRHVNYLPGDGASDVRVVTEISYSTTGIEDGEPLKPLARRNLYVLDKAKPRGRIRVDESPPDELCAGQEGSVDSPSLPMVKGNPIHWLVPPGRHLYEMDVTDMLALETDTTAHYVTGHIHTDSDWLRLVERDTGKVVLELRGSRFPGRRGLRDMSYISSREGVPLSASKRYKLVASYTNPGHKPVDAMAILYLYILDKKRS